VSFEENPWKKGRETHPLKTKNGMGKGVRVKKHVMG
jgi:hypothetical protein